MPSAHDHGHTTRSPERLRGKDVDAPLLKVIAKAFGVAAQGRDGGLLFPSLVTAIVRTVRRTMIDRKLGSVTKADLQAVERELRRAPGL